MESPNSVLSYKHLYYCITVIVTLLVKQCYTTHNKHFPWVLTTQIVQLSSPVTRNASSTDHGKH